MKTTILVSTLICGCITFTYSQINEKRKQSIIADKLSSFHFGIKPVPDFKKMTGPNSFAPGKKVERFSTSDNEWTSRTTGNAFVPDSMPCYKPEGVFSMKIVKPDTSSRYTMLIERY